MNPETDISTAPAPGNAEPATVATAAAADRSQASRAAWVRWLGAGLVLAVIVIVALAATLRHQQQQLDNFGREATRRLDEIVVRADQATQQAQQAQTLAQSLDGRVASLDKRSQRLEDQQKTLAQSYRELIHGNDEAILVNVEQSIMLAAEQLQLAGNVPVAIAGLQLAEARLARAGRAAFMPAQQALARDLNRLQALPLVDIGVISARLDALIDASADLPLAAVGFSGPDAPPAPAAPEAPQAPAGAGQPADAEPTSWWRRAWEPMRDWAADLRGAAAEELKTLVHVRRIDQPEALLLAPEQSAWLRANLALRLLDARMALLARETAVWHSDLDAATQAIERYADLQAPATRRMLQILADLRAIEPAPKLPDLQDSLATVRALLASADAQALEALESQDVSKE